MTPKSYFAGLLATAYFYDSYYSYTPTPEQQATAKRQVEAYLLAVKKGIDTDHLATGSFVPFIVVAGCFTNKAIEKRHKKP